MSTNAVTHEPALSTSPTVNKHVSSNAPCICCCLVFYYVCTEEETSQTSQETFMDAFVAGSSRKWKCLPQIIERTAFRRPRDVEKLHPSGLQAVPGAVAASYPTHCQGWHQDEEGSDCRGASDTHPSLFGYRSVPVYVIMYNLQEEVLKSFLREK